MSVLPSGKWLAVFVVAAVFIGIVIGYLLFNAF